MSQLRDWARKQPIGDINHLNSKLVDWAEKELGFSTQPQPYGADGCPALRRLLAWGYRNGYLRRYRVNMTGMRGMGFPSWIYSYEF